jgi:hypothetical protein
VRRPTPVIGPPPKAGELVTGRMPVCTYTGTERLGAVAQPWRRVGRSAERQPWTTPLASPAAFAGSDRSDLGRGQPEAVAREALRRRRGDRQKPPVMIGRGGSGGVCAGGSGGAKAAAKGTSRAARGAGHLRVVWPSRRRRPAWLGCAVGVGLGGSDSRLGAGKRADGFREATAAARALTTGVEEGCSHSPRRETGLSYKSCSYRYLRAINILIIGPATALRGRRGEGRIPPYFRAARCGAVPQKAHFCSVGKSIDNRERQGQPGAGPALSVMRDHFACLPACTWPATKRRPARALP